MNLLIGLLLATLGGGIQGAFVYPQKFMKNWKWENGWFIFTITCCMIFPVILAFATNSGLIELYKQIDSSTLWYVFLAGIGWGIGVVLFGLGVEYMGMALGIAIITALNATIGTVLPIFFLPNGIFTPLSLIILSIGLVMLIIGVIVISMAGKQREKDQTQTEVPEQRSKVSFKVGLIVCIVAAIFCPSTIFAVHFSKPIAEAAMASGLVSSINVGWSQLFLWYIGGFIVNSIYCIYLFNKNKSLGKFKSSGKLKNTLLGVSMSAFFLIGMVLLTVATEIFLGKTGAIIAWPLFLAATIMCANILGLMSGEWKGVSRKATNQLYAGIALLIVAIIIVSSSNQFN
ncbi:MAG: L-rhamnose/proton symporter RhaT [Bacteroidales bacterium]